jgi:hypothetical protein
VAFCELIPEVLGSLWLVDSETWGEIPLAEGLHVWGRRDLPLLNHTLTFVLQLRKSTETALSVAELLLVAPTLPPF